MPYTWLYFLILKAEIKQVEKKRISIISIFRNTTMCKRNYETAESRPSKWSIKFKSIKLNLQLF